MDSSTQIVEGPNRNQEEVEKKRAELAGLREKASRLEREVALLRSELSKFERLYFQTVGRKYILLDELKARIAEKLADLFPSHDSFARRAWQNRFRAERSSRQYRTWKDGKNSPPTSAGRIKIPRDAKRLYRKIAARVHPDLAVDEQSRGARTVVMTALNEAYARGDISAMKAILREWENSPEAEAPFSLAAESARLERNIRQIQERIRRLAQEKDLLAASEMYALMETSRRAKREGRDILAELSAELDLEIERLRQNLADLG